MNKLEKAAHFILKKCLKLNRGSSFGLVIDQTTTDIVHAFENACLNNSIELITYFFSVESQSKFRPENINSIISQSMNQNEGIVLCTTGDDSCTKFRQHLISLRPTISNNLKFATIPGCTKWLLENTVIADYDKMVREASDLCVPLSIGKYAKIVTESNESEYNLNFDLGGWDRMPVASTGVIEEGTWGNIPGAEAYIVPVERTAKGDIIINGSIPNYVFKDDEYLLLQFSEGNLYQWKSNVKEANDYMDGLAKQSKEAGDDNWTNLAEMGIGLNESIKKLTGNTLVDEKVAKTIHVAIGNNFNWGGSIKSEIHVDFPTNKPTLFIDEEKIMEKGELVFETDKFLPSIDKMKTSEGAIKYENLDVELTLRTYMIRLKDDDIYRTWKNAAGRSGMTKIGNAKDHILMAKIIKEFNKHSVIKLKALIENLNNYDKESVLNALRLLDYYEVIEYYK